MNCNASDSARYRDVNDALRLEDRQSFLDQLPIYSSLELVFGISHTNS